MSYLGMLPFSFAVSRASHTCSHLESLLNTNPLTDQQRASLIMLKEIFVYTPTGKYELDIMG